MAKGKRGSKTNPLKKADLETLDERSYIIKEATIKDDFCNYTYEITKGTGEGDIHTVKGKGLIKDELRDALVKFHVHLACVDDVFKHSGIEIEDIDKFHTDELTGLYFVTGFKIKGPKENESIILNGNKHVSAAGGYIDMETPKIALDNLSSYKWWNELKDAADEARRQVELYKEGNYTPVEKDEDPAFKQMTIGQVIDEEENELVEN